MNSSIKQPFSLLISFVDRSLLPLIEPKNSEVMRVLQQWTQIKKYITETDHIQTWKLEKLISEQKQNHSVSAINSYAKVNIENDKGIVRATSFYDNPIWKNTNNLIHSEPERKDNYVGLDMNREQKVQPKINLDSFENLLSSFKKLCTNFQNNHKKLMMDRQSFVH